MQDIKDSGAPRDEGYDDLRDIKPFEPLWDERTSIKLLGQGSFGKVYKMVKRERGKEYYAAVKHLSLPSKPDEADELYAQGKVNSVDHATMKKYYDDALEKLLSEIDLLEKVKANTNIVSYEGFRKIDKPSGIGYDIFIKMELLTGLPNHIAGGGLTVQDVAKLGEDICRALMVLRVEEIVHRDIKPANILVNSRGDYKLGDFGVSNVANQVSKPEETITQPEPTTASSPLPHRRPSHPSPLSGRIPLFIMGC